MRKKALHTSPYSASNLWAKTAIIFFLFFLALLESSPCAEVVKVDGGMVKGVIEDNLLVFKGIPYAAAPIGNLRWRAPQPVQKWQGVRMANEFGRACMQSNPAIANLPEPSEDCLYLNLWTPIKRAENNLWTPIKRAEKKLPVMVWIHGGGFSAGATAEKLYHGENLAKKGVIVVTLGYRLGVFGFLAHPALSAENEKHVSGNYGLLDMIAALNWVQRNIASFGGDPRQVTIFGESAGGIAVSMLCASPLAKGLFHRAISQSGGSFGPIRKGGGPGENMQSLADAEKAGAAWALKIGASSVTDLRRMAADKLLAAGQGQRGLAWPVVDGWIIPDDQFKLYQAGRYNDIPILAGYNSDEGATFPGPKTPEAYIESVRERFGPFAERLLALYPAGQGGTLAKTARDLQRDVAFGWHTWTWARLQSKTGKSKAFLYYYDHHPDYPPGSPKAGFGAAHSDEMPLVFQQFGLPGRPAENPIDRALSEIITTYWTNFAKNGDPNGPGLPYWPAYSDEKPTVMHFVGGKALAGPVVHEEGLKTLDDYFAWRRATGPDTETGTAPVKANR